MVFAGFGREDFIFRAFAKIFRIGLALPHFSCILFFFLEIKYSWRNLGFTVDNVTKNKVIQVFGVWIEHSPYVFDSVFDSKFNISP